MDMITYMMIIVVISGICVYLKVRNATLEETIYDKEVELQSLEALKDRFKDTAIRQDTFIARLEEQIDYREDRINELEDEVAKTRPSVKVGRKFKKITME